MISVCGRRESFHCSQMKSRLAKAITCYQSHISPGTPDSDGGGGGTSLVMKNGSFDNEKSISIDPII